MSNNNRLKNSTKNIVFSLISQVILIILKFVNRTVFINTLGKEYLGISGLFADILHMLSLAELGIDTAINYKLYKPLANKDTRKLQAIMKFYSQSYIFIGLTIFLLGLLLLPYLPHLIKDYEKIEKLNINATYIFLLYLSNSALSYWFFASRTALIKADQKEYIITTTNLISQLFLNIIQIILLYFIPSFIYYVLLMIIVNIANNLINSIIAKRKYKTIFEKNKEKLSIIEIKDIFKDLLAVFVFKINTIAMKSTDNIVIGYYLGLSNVALYSNYLMFYTGVKTLSSKFYSAIKASAGNLFATGNTQQKYEYFELMNFITIILFGSAACCISVVGNEFIINWLGNSFLLDQYVSVLIGIEILFAGIKMNLSQIRNILGLFRQMWLRPLLGVILNIILSIILVNYYNIAGVILGTLITDIVTNFLVDPFIVYKYAFNNLSPKQYYAKNLKYIAILTIEIILINQICKNTFLGLGWLSVIIHSIISLALFPMFFITIFNKTKPCQKLFSIIQRITK